MNNYRLTIKKPTKNDYISRNIQPTKTESR